MMEWQPWMTGAALALLSCLNIFLGYRWGRQERPRPERCPYCRERLA